MPSCPPATEPEVLPGLTEADCAQIQLRKREIEGELLVMGASADFCRNYFLRQMGSCDKIRGCSCTKHSSCNPVLPPHLMDADEFRSCLADIDDGLRRVRTDVDAFKRKYREETADGFTAAGEAEQNGKKRKVKLEQKLRHAFGLQQKLKSEEYRLLEEVKPIRENAWHEACTRLLDEKTRLNRLLKCGRPAVAGQPAAV